MKKILMCTIAVLFTFTIVIFVGCDSAGLNDDSSKTNITLLNIEQTGGIDNVSDSTGLLLSFDIDPTTLTENEIAVIGATKGALAGTGLTRSLSISAITVDNGADIEVYITNPNGYVMQGSPKVTSLYRKNYNLRDTGPAGGLIFYDKGFYSDGWRYLEAAPYTTQWSDKVWGGYGSNVTGADGTDIGTGKQNTIDIVTYLGDSEPYQNKTDYAAKLCADLDFGGWDDWFLPSKDESYQMYNKLKEQGVGDFSGWYITSSEYSDEFEHTLNFNDGSWGHNNKSYFNKVRAIRSF